MLIIRALLLIASGLALTTPTVAQEQASAFEYSAVVRILRSGHFQAEVWRRDVRTDQGDLAWSNSAFYPSATAAMIEACAALRKDFDETFSCSPVAPQQAVGASATMTPSGTAMSGKGAAPAVDPKAASMKKPVGPERTSDASGAWLKDFWRSQERQFGGGGDGGGSGGGSGGGGY
jgi:hypothetical protein